MPTAHGAQPLNKLFAESDEQLPAWPDPEGTARGYKLEPLYASVPEAAKADSLETQLRGTTIKS